MKVIVGYYTGNGVDGRTIALTGMGGTPDLLVIKGSGTEAVIRTSTMVGDATKSLIAATAFFTGGVKDISPSAFTLGTDTRVNAAGVIYHVLAIRNDGAGDFSVFTYVGDGVDNRNLDGLLANQPDMAWVFREGISTLVWTSTKHSADSSSQFSALPTSNRIQSFRPTGIQIGNNADVNAGASTYHGVLFKEAASAFKLLSYVGDGADNRSITGAGFAPDWALTENISIARAAVIKTPAHVGDPSSKVDATADIADHIQALQADGFQVGTANPVNNSPNNYVAFVFKTSAGAVGGSLTERSRFWDGLVTGDANQAPYDAATEFADVLSSIAGVFRFTANKGGVFRSELNQLAASLPTPAATPVRIASGHALVYGNWYENDSNNDITIPTPAVSTRIDRIVLRKSWASQTVRLTRIAGVEGGGAPAITQTAGTTWDIPLYQIQITTGGVVTIIGDEREYLPADFLEYNSWLNALATQRDSVWYNPADLTVSGSTNAVNALQGLNGTALLVTTATNPTTGKLEWTITGLTTTPDIGGIDVPSLSFRPAENYGFKALLRQSQAPVGGTVEYDAGFRLNATTGQQDGVYFRSINGGNWFLVCRSGGAETTVDMGVAPSATLKLLELRIMGDGTVIQGFVDGDSTILPIIDTIPAGPLLMLVFVNNRAGVTTTGAILKCQGMGFIGDIVA